MSHWKPGQRVEGARGQERVTDGFAQHVDEVGVFAIRFFQSADERREVAGIGPRGQRFGGAAFHQGVGVAQMDQECAPEIARIEQRGGTGEPGLAAVSKFSEQPHRVDLEQRISRREARTKRFVVERGQIEQGPERVDLGVGLGLTFGEVVDASRGEAELRNGGRAEPVFQFVLRQEAPREAGGTEFFDEALEIAGQSGGTERRSRRGDEADIGPLIGVRLPPHVGGYGVGVDHTPDAAALAVATGMRQRHFVVADDAVVEIGHVERAVGAEGVVHGTEPRIGRREEIGLLDGLGRGADEGDLVPVQPAGHDVADEERVVVFGGPEVVGVVDGTVDGGAAVGVLQHDGREAESVVGLAEARVMPAGEELVERRAVAVAGVEVAAWIEGEAEGVHLAVGVVLQFGTVEAEAVGVAGIQVDDGAVAVGDPRIVVEAVRGVDPAVEAAPERCLVAMGVAGMVEGAVERGAFVGFPVAVGVFQQPDVGDAPDDGFPRFVRSPAFRRKRAFLIGGSFLPAKAGATCGAERIHADGDVEPVGELRDLARAAVGSEVLEDHEAIAAGAVGRRGPGILDARRRPEPAGGVEGEVHRLVDVRLGGDELDVEAGRELELGPLFGGRDGIGRPDHVGKWICGGDGQSRSQNQGGNDAGKEDGRHGKVGRVATEVIRDGGSRGKQNRARQTGEVRKARGVSSSSRITGRFRRLVEHPTFGNLMSGQRAVALSLKAVP